MENSNAENQVPAVIAALRRFAKPRSNAERCDLCSLELAAEHSHLIEPNSRQIVCSCDACAILFSGKADTKYKRIPRQTRFLPDFQLSDMQWDDLLIPIGMAFFFHSTPAQKTLALYPSPAGSVESLLELETWHEIEQANPILQAMEADTEALLVNRVGGRKEYYLAPIDKCFELVGLIRANWHGLSGGTEVWEAIDGFFAKLRENSISINRKSQIANRKLSKLTVRISNTTPFEKATKKSRDEALAHSLVSAHVVLFVQNGEFISLLEPPDEMTEAAATCRNIATYPILVGENGERNCFLSSPIILYDYPEIAPESAGDLFDGGEIDEILTLRILTMTDDEKREMQSVDERSRKMLERTENLSAEQLMKMHGVLRQPRAFGARENAPRSNQNEDERIGLATAGG